MEQIKMGINSISSSSLFNNPQMIENSVSRPEGFQGSSKDVFVHDDNRDFANEQAFASAGRLFKSHASAQAHKAEGPITVQGDGVNMYRNRAGYDSSFLGKELPLPELGSSIKDKVAMRTDKPGEYVLPYTHFSIVMNGERKQCFYTISNIDGATHQDLPRSGKWELDGRIPRECQLGNEAYRNNDIDKGHMVRRLDPCWGKEAKQANNDTFSYCNATLQHAGLNQKEWLNLENHVLDSATSGNQKMTVITGPIFSDDDPKFTNNGAMKKPVQIPMQFFKTVVWADEKTGNLKSASFVLSQKDIIESDHTLGISGFDPDKFSVYQVPQKQLEQMTDLHFGNIGDITKEPVRLTAENDFAPQGLDK